MCWLDSLPDYTVSMAWFRVPPSFSCVRSFFFLCRHLERKGCWCVRMFMMIPSTTTPTLDLLPVSSSTPSHNGMCGTITEITEIRVCGDTMCVFVFYTCAVMHYIHKRKPSFKLYYIQCFVPIYTLWLQIIVKLTLYSIYIHVALVTFVTKVLTIS